MKRLLLTSFQSPGDVVMLTAAVRDLQLAHPGQFAIDVRSSAPELWANNPHLTRFDEGATGVERIDMHYPLVHESNQRPYHFLHGYIQFLEARLGLRIPVSRFHGDLHLSAAEKEFPVSWRESGVARPYWIMVAGGKYDFTAKWWNPASYQAIVDRFAGRIRFVQCGEADHWHPRLRGVVDLIGKTNIREFVRLMHHADGVICPVTFAMHLAAAVEDRRGQRGVRPCVVVAGGREPAHWEAYPNHQYISTNGALSCCRTGGCWKSRCQLVGDGDPKDVRDVCEQPVVIAPNLRIPRCLEMIAPDDVVRRVEWYFQGGALSYDAESPGTRSDLAQPSVAQPSESLSSGVVSAGAAAVSSLDQMWPRSSRAMAEGQVAIAKPVTSDVLLKFRHGLGDAMQLTAVLRHLRELRPDWNIDVASLAGKDAAFHNLCRQSLLLDEVKRGEQRYQQCFDLDWHEASSAHPDWPSTKVTRCLHEVFGVTPRLDLCRYELAIPADAIKAARGYLASVCGVEDTGTGRFPAVLIHYEGNTSSERKNLSHDVIRETCEVIRRNGHTPVILDWDRRSPLVDQTSIFNPAADHPLWQGRGTGDAAVIGALIENARLMIGIDSGPLHVAGATSTPTVGVWTRHHPLHYFDLAENVTHLVPGNHESLLKHPRGLPFFRQHYRHVVYKQLQVELPAFVDSLLSGQPFERLANQRFLQQLRARSYHREYYVEHKEAGLDYLGFGDWQRRYGRWLAEVFQWTGSRVLDVGCACGAVMRGLGEAGIIVQGVDVNEYMIQLGRQQWPDMASLLFVCDAVNLHLFDDGTWDGIHTAQVAEHWKPELAPFILRELHRVVRPGGLLFCALDTVELFARQNRSLEHEDPTHICVRPLAWWHEQLAESGWRVASAEFEPKLWASEDSFLRQYDWDWFVARRESRP